MRKVLLVVGLWLLWPAVAQAHTTITCDSCSFPYQQWVDQAKVPTPDVTLAVVEDASECGETTRACTAPGSMTIWLDPAKFYPRGSFMHELGHNLDYYALTDSKRMGFLAIIHRESPWRTDAGTTSPHEIFAEAYRFCAMPRTLRTQSKPLGLRRQGRLAQACHLVRGV